MRRSLIALALLAMPLVVGACAREIPVAEVQPKYTSPASQFLTLKDGTRLHVRDEGKRDAPVLLLLHGSNASLHTWEPWVERLGDDYRLISLDFPAHGLTGPTPVADYSVERYVSIVDEVTTQLGVSQFSIAGNSMGGWVAWRTALEHPERVQSLILVNAAGYPWDEDRGISIFTLIRTPVVGELLSGFASPDLYRRNLEALFVDQTKVTDAMVMRYYELNSLAGQPRATLARLRITPAKMDAWKDIPKISVPTLILWGDKDNLIPVSVAERFAQDLPVAETIIYPNVGHIPMEEVPDQSATDVGTFLDGVIGRQLPVAAAPVRRF